MEKVHEIPWSKQPRQMTFLRACGLDFPITGGVPRQAQADVIFYGGAAGGGKSDALLIAAIIACNTFPKIQVGYFRRKYPELEGPGGAIMRSKELLTGYAVWNGQNRRWTFRNGAVLQFCHAQKEDDVTNYQSQQFDILLIDESTHFTEYMIRYLQTRNRATIDGAKIGGKFYKFKPFMALASNPGKYSHGWHKRNFVDIGPPGVVYSVEFAPGVFLKHLFIPAFLQDNVVLEQRDPGYRIKLESQPEEIKRALLDGDWSVFAGQYFKSFRYHLHVITPFELPWGWTRFGCMDWGYAAPCALYWNAVDPANGRVITYREVYVTEKRPEEIAEIFNELSKDDPEIRYVAASPDIWKEKGLMKRTLGGETIAEVMINKGMPLTRADNRRVMGWTRMRDYLTIAPDGKPYWLIFNTCVNLIRTLPELIHDDKKVEDVDENCEDHAPEAMRYGLMSRPSPIDAKEIYPGGLPGDRPRGSFSREEWDEDDEDELGPDDLPGFY